MTVGSNLRSWLTPPNDWPLTRHLLVTALVLTVTACSMLVAEYGQLRLPLIQQIFGLVVLLYLPGSLILRILRIHRAGIVDSAFYAIGLSILFTIAVGISVNFSFPPLGIEQPLTATVLIISVILITILLSVIAYLREKGYVPVVEYIPADQPGKQYRFSKLNVYLISALLPLLSILGTQMVNLYDSNVILIALNIIVLILICLAVLTDWFSTATHYFLIYMLALSMILQTSLISADLIGSDIHLEYYLSELVRDNGYWDPAIGLSVNSCLSVVILAPVLSLISNIDIVWLFKLVYPALFCIVPLIIYHVFSFQMNKKIALLSAIFFVTLPMFTMDMVQLIRQQIAELFFCLAILVFIENKLTLTNRLIFLLLFIIGVIVSYYGLGTATIGYFVFSSVFIVIIKSKIGRRIWQWLTGNQVALLDDLYSKSIFKSWHVLIIVGLSFIFLAWYYNNVAGGQASTGLNVIAGVADATASGVAQGSYSFLDPLTKEPLVRTALGLDFNEASTGGQVWRVFQILIELSLIIGLIRLVFKPLSISNRLNISYISLVFANLFVILGLFILPGHSYGLGLTRIWQITLIVMSPLIIYGIISIGQALAFLCKRLIPSAMSAMTLSLLPNSVLALILGVYFIFNSGLVFELTRSNSTNFIDIPYSIALSNSRIDLSTAFNRQDKLTADWLFKHKSDDYALTADYQGSKLFLQYELLTTTSKWQIFVYNKYAASAIHINLGKSDYISYFTSIPRYLLLRTWNIANKAITVSSEYGIRIIYKFDEIEDFNDLIQQCNIIYSNNGGLIIECPGLNIY